MFAPVILNSGVTYVNHLSWTLTQPQNNYQRLESITTGILRDACSVLTAIHDGTLPTKLVEGINHYTTFRQLLTAVSILCGDSKDYSYVEVLQLFQENQSLCYPLFDIDAATRELMEIALEGVLSETIAPDLRRKNPESLPQMTRPSLTSLLQGAVVEERALDTKELVEKGKNVFGKLVETNQTVFNWELLAIGSVLEYLRNVLGAVDTEGLDSVTREQRVGRVLRMTRVALNFVLTFETVEPTCVGDVVMLMEVAVNMHDYLCDSLYTLMRILKDHVGNPVVQINMEAYIAARLFGSLFAAEETLASILEAVKSKQQVTLPCLHATALAFAFSRDVFARLRSGRTTVVDEKTYKNFSRIPAVLQVFSNSIDVLAVQSFVTLTLLILIPNGLFLDTLFALLLTAFVGVGYEEALEKQRLRGFERDEVDATYTHFNVDYEFTRVVPLYMAVHVFADSPCPDLQMYVKQNFTKVHLECLWTVIICQSPKVSINSDGNPPFGPLVSDPESITNLRVLLKQIVVNGYLSDANIQRLLEMRRDQYPLTAPSELVVFASRLWIHRIGYRTQLNNQDDPLALKEWDAFLAALERLIASPDEWGGEECVSYEVMCLLLFIYHNLSNIARVEYMRKLFALVRSVPQTITTSGVVGLTRVFLILDYTIRHYSDFSSDLLDELKNTLLARSFEEHGSLQHDTCIIPAFIEKLNYSDALFSITVGTRHRKVPDNGYIRFYGFTRFERYEDCLVDLRLAMHYPLGAVVMLWGTDEYKQTYDKLLELLADCTVRPPKDPALQTATFMLGEYYFNSLWTIMCLLPPPQPFIDRFKTDTALFKTTPVGNLLLHNVNWLTNFCYIGKKQDSKFYDQVDVNSIRMQHHLEALVGVLQRLSEGGAADYTRRDAVVEAIVQFLTCASLTTDYLDVYRMELQLRRGNDARAVAKETLTQTAEERRAFEKGIEEMRRAERQHKQEKEEQRKREKKELQAVQKAEQKLGYKTIFGKLRKKDKGAARSDKTVDFLETCLQQCDNRRKRKLLKNREKWDEPVDAPARLVSAMQALVFKKPAAFFDLIGKLRSGYREALTTQQLVGILRLDRGIIVDMARGKDVAWKTSGLLSVLFDGISDATLATYATEMVLTPETVEFVAHRWGQKLYLWEDEFYHPLQHVLDAAVSCPLRPENRAYYVTVASVQKIIKSLITVATLVSIQAKAVHQFEQTALMSALLQIIPDRGFRYTHQRAVELAQSMGTEANAPLLIAQSTLCRGDMFLRYVLGREGVQNGTDACVLECLDGMERAVRAVREAKGQLGY